MKVDTRFHDNIGDENGCISNSIYEGGVIPLHLKYSLSVFDVVTANHSNAVARLLSLVPAYIRS